MLRTRLSVALGWTAGLTIAVGAIGVRPAWAQDLGPASSATDASVDATVTDALPAEATDQMPAAALEVQQALGGPIANQFPQLQAPPDPSPWWRQFSGSPEVGAPSVATTTENPWPTWWTPARPRTVVKALAEAPTTVASHSPQVAALRRTAAELELTANRLEEIELYRQADALREFAQRFRVDARAAVARLRGAQRPGAAGPEGLPMSGNSGRRPNVGVPLPSSAAEAEYGGAVSHDSAASHEQEEASGAGHAADERSVIVGPAPE